MQGSTSSPPLIEAVFFSAHPYGSVNVSLTVSALLSGCVTPAVNANEYSVAVTGSPLVGAVPPISHRLLMTCSVPGAWTPSVTTCSPRTTPLASVVLKYTCPGSQMNSPVYGPAVLAVWSP